MAACALQSTLSRLCRRYSSPVLGSLSYQIRRSYAQVAVSTTVARKRSFPPNSWLYLDKKKKKEKDPFCRHCVVSQQVTFTRVVFISITNKYQDGFIECLEGNVSINNILD